MLEDLKIYDLMSYLGKPTKKIGVEYVWQCPYCLDSHKDNLKYNEQKQILKCFADDTHAGKVLSEINRIRGINTPQKDNPALKPIETPSKLTLKETIENLEYLLRCQEVFEKNTKAQQHIEEKRGITFKTASLYGIGIDTETHSWVIPIWKYSTSPFNTPLIGFELRPALLPNAIKEKRTEKENEAKKNIRRKRGSLSKLAMINCKTPNAKNLVIVEGFMDGLVLWQYLQEKNIDSDYHIVTPSNGIGVLLKQIESIEFSKYENFILYVDADEQALKIADEIKEKYPFFKMIQLDCNCKDFNEHYLKCIKEDKNNAS